MATKKTRAPEQWTKEELKLLGKLDTPWAVQQFLDSVEYSEDHFYRCPRRVMADRKAHCTDGALFSAACLRRMGHAPLIMELLSEPGRDDDHLLAIYKVRGCFGAVAKSNFSTLRYREPVYRTMRELVMSYFDGYFNTVGERTLRAYSGLLDLSKLDYLDWMTRDEGIEAVIERLVATRHYPILDKAQVARLHDVDARSFQAGMLGSKADGLFRPES